MGITTFSLNYNNLENNRRLSFMQIGETPHKRRGTRETDFLSLREYSQKKLERMGWEKLMREGLVFIGLSPSPSLLLHSSRQPLALFFKIISFLFFCGQTTTLGPFLIFLPLLLFSSPYFPFFCQRSNLLQIYCRPQQRNHMSFLMLCGITTL